MKNKVIIKGDNARNRRIHRNNSSGVAGVYWCKRQKKWRARIKWKNKRVHLGYYDDINIAASVIAQYKQAN